MKLNRKVEQGIAFSNAISCGKYLFLIPQCYPAIVRYDTMTGEIRYFEEHLDINVDIFQGERRVGGCCVQNGYLFLASPIDNHVLALHVETGNIQVMTTGAENNCGCAYLVPDGEELWLIPYEGYIVTRWNPESGELQEYDCNVEEMKCVHPAGHYVCETMPFGFPAVLDDAVYLSANWGNRYLRLDKKTGEVKVWTPPYEQMERPVNSYYPLSGKASFLCLPEAIKNGWTKMFSYLDKKLYRINLYTNEYREEKLSFSVEELREQEIGFCDHSENSMYVAVEGVYHSLSDFLAGRIRGNAYDCEKAIQSFRKIAVNNDGTCGEKTYEFVRNKLRS